MTTPTDDLVERSLQTMQKLASHWETGWSGEMARHYVEKCARQAASALASAKAEIERLKVELGEASHGADQWRDACKSAEAERDKLSERCEGYKGQVEYGAAEIERLRNENFALAADQCEAGIAGEHGEHRCATIDSLRRELAQAKEDLHYANGVCDLALKHRDMAEAKLAASQAREIKVRWEDRLDQRFPIAVAFIGTWKVGSIEKASAKDLWHTYIGLKRLDAFVDLTSARAAVEAAAIEMLTSQPEDQAG